MSKEQQGLLTIGAFIIIVAIVLIIAAGNLISWWEVIPLIIAFNGCWLIAAAGIRAKNPSKYERSAFSLFGWGILLAAVGFGLDLNVRGLPPVFTLALILLLLGALAVVAAISASGRKR